MITLQNILDVANETFKTAEAKGYRITDTVSFSVNTRLNRTLGRFMVETVYIGGGKMKKKYTIDITGRYQEVCEEFIDTVRHEIAHFIAYTNFDEDMSHGKQWKKVAIDLGAKPSATVLLSSTQPVEPPKIRRKMRAKCVCCPKVYKINPITKMQVNSSMIVCPTCKVKKLFLIMSDI